MAEIYQITAIPKETAVTQSQDSSLINWILLLLVVVGLVVLIYFLSKFIFKTKKERFDVNKQDYKTVKRLCNLQKSNQFFKPFLYSTLFRIGSPVILVHPSLDPVKTINPEIAEKLKPEKVKPDITRLGSLPTKSFFPTFDRSLRIGRYAGHCSTKDGCVNLLVNSNIRRFLFFRDQFIIKLRKGVQKKIITKDSKGVEIEEIVDVPPDIYSMGSDIITLNCLNLQQIGEYMYPVNIDEYGRIVDNRTYIYHDIMGIASEKQMTQFGKNTVYAIQEAIRINPYAQWSKNVEQETIRSTE